MKQVLVFGLSSNIGGTETVFDSFYDGLKIKGYHFDFIARESEIAFQEKYKKDGARTFVVPNFITHPMKYYRTIKKIITDNKYDIVHINMLSAANPLPIIAARKAKVESIVAHSHNNSTSGILRKILHTIGKHVTKKNYVTKIACSEDAGNYIFGKSQFDVINNPFNNQEFVFNNKKRAIVREQYGISNDCILIGCVGRLADQKNPLFLIDVLAKIKKQEGREYRLMFVGDGKLKKKLVHRAKRRGVLDHIIITGNIKNVSDFYSAFDIFVMPSKYEGLGMVALEAQAAGLPCLFSNAVPKDVDILNVKHMNLDASNWADYLVTCDPSRTKVTNQAFKKFGINVNTELLAHEYKRKLASEKIDFVIMWVDPSDPKWQKEKAKYSPASNTDSSARRYRDWDNLQYWFRGVEKYAPWVNNIYFVTYGHIPKWLNTDHPKLKIVKHSEFIPKEYLPTFSANPIELNIHRIEGLSERFVFFNDDFFLINKTKPTDFFKNNHPCDSACMYMNIPSGDVVDSLFINDMAIINKHFSIRKVLRKNPFKWFNYKNGKYLYNNIAMSVYGGFPGLHFSHLPASFCKKTYRELWSVEYDKMNDTCMNKFRSTNDVNQWLIKYWQICNGNFVPRNVNWGKYYEYSMGYDVLEKTIMGKKFKTTCINDTVPDNEFEKAKNITNRIFEKKFPNKSEFER